MPQLIPRSQWNDRGNSPGGYAMGIVSQVVCHHTPGQDGQGDYNTALEEVRQIRNSHIDSNGWSDIGYTFLVSGDFVFEGRGWGYTGAHAPGANSSSIGIAFILDGRYREPTPTEWASAKWICDQSVARGYLTSSYAVQGHRDHVSTECPASLVYNNLHKLRLAQPGPGTTPGGAELDQTERGMLEAVFKAVGQIPDPNMRTAYEMIRHLNNHDWNNRFWPGMAEWLTMYFNDLKGVEGQRFQAFQNEIGTLRNELVNAVKAIQIPAGTPGTPSPLDTDAIVDKIMARVAQKLQGVGA